MEFTSCGYKICHNHTPVQVNVKDSFVLITCVIARSNPRRLLPIWREKLRGHYHVTMTSDKWLMRVTLALSRAPFARKRKRTNNLAQCTPYSRTYHIVQWSSHLDWSKFVYRDEYRNEKNAVFFMFLSKKNKTHKTHEIVKVAVINDNNNFAPYLFRSLCEFVGDCFGPRYFSSGDTLPQQNTSVQNNHLRFHTMTSKKMVHTYYCLINELFSCSSANFCVLLYFIVSAMVSCGEWCP